MFYKQDNTSAASQQFFSREYIDKLKREEDLQKEKEAPLLKQAKEILFHLIKNQILKDPNRVVSEELIDQRARDLSATLINMHKSDAGYYDNAIDFTSAEKQDAYMKYSDAFTFITSLQRLKMEGKSIAEIQKYLAEKSSAIPKKSISAHREKFGTEWALIDKVLEMFHTGAYQSKIVNFLSDRKKEIEDAVLKDI